MISAAMSPENGDDDAIHDDALADLDALIALFPRPGLPVETVAEATSEVDEKLLGEVVAELDADADEASPTSGLSTSLRAEIERSKVRLFMSPRDREREGAIEAERQRAIEAGRLNLSTDREAVRKRLDKRRQRGIKAPPMQITDLPKAVGVPIFEEAKERLKALKTATAADRRSPRLTQLKGREDECSKWWLAERFTIALGRKPSLSQVALVRNVMTKGPAPKFSKRSAQSALDLIRSLEAPGEPWHAFAK